MSQMNTYPVFKCRRCGKPVTVAYCATAQPDEDLIQLTALMKSLERVALCGNCQAAYNYYASQGRSDEFFSLEIAQLLTVNEREINDNPN